MAVISPVPTDANGNAMQTGHLKELGKDDFLQLLITQLQHQDPMNPLEDADFIAELAQFSSLEQINNMNDLLTENLDLGYLQMQTINNTMATSLIGREVEADFSAVYLDEDNTPKVTYNTLKPADQITIKVTDASGNVVATHTVEGVGVGSHSFTWDGHGDNGDRLPVGVYDITISGTDTEGNSFTPSMYISGKVEGVAYREGSAFLKVNGVEIPLAGINVINESEEG